MTPVIPSEITVHLGRPNAPAENVTVPFTDYIKNVASSEIYPTWPEAAIRANILAQISFALNRVYTEYYRSRGYDFDITNTTSNDQAYTKDGEVYENISRIADEIFNNYIVRSGRVEPLFAQFCDGVQTQCRGLSQWGSAELARQYVKLGADISLAGPVTFKNARKPVEVVQTVPLEHLFVETDSPYMAPVPFRGTTNTPVHVEEVAKKFAEIKGLTLEEVAEATFRNACDFYGIEI